MPPQAPNSKTAKTLAIITTLCALLVSHGLNIAYRSQYYLMGVNFIYSYQSKYQTPTITVIQNIISIFGNTYFVVAFLFLVHLAFHRKLATIVYLSYISVNAYLLGVEKQAYHDPRPFFFNSQIQALEWTCPRSFGFPSGHSWFSVLLYELFLSDFIGTSGWKKCLLIWPILTGTLIPISRQYLGSHTSDEVTFGILNSFCALLIYKYLLQQKIYSIFTKIINGLSLKLLLIINSLALAFFIALPCILYFVNTVYRPFDPSYILLMNQACGQNKSQGDLEAEAGKGSAIIGLVVGFVYGLVLNHYPSIQKRFQIPNRQGNLQNFLNIYLAGHWQFGSICNISKFLLSYILLGGLTAGGIGFSISAAIRNFYGSFLVQLLGFILFGMAVTCFIPLTLNWIQAIIIQESKVKLEARTNDQLSPKTIELN